MVGQTPAARPLPRSGRTCTWSARTTRVSIENNASQCLSLLATRYGVGTATDAQAAQASTARSTP
jgi:hypothetical protein